METTLDNFGQSWTTFDFDENPFLKWKPILIDENYLDDFGPLFLMNTTLDYFGQLWTTLFDENRNWLIIFLRRTSFLVMKESKTILDNFGQLWPVYKF